MPCDRRVWLECRTLTEPATRWRWSAPRVRGPFLPGHRRSPDYKYRPYCPGGGAASFFLEYAYSFAATLTSRSRPSGRSLRRSPGCNPPDIFWPIGVLFRLWHGSRFVFDHHDLCPETFESRFPEGSPLLYTGLRFLERCTTRFADHVVSTNDRTEGW